MAGLMGMAGGMGAGAASGAGSGMMGGAFDNAIGGMDLANSGVPGTAPEPTGLMGMGSSSEVGRANTPDVSKAKSGTMARFQEAMGASAKTGRRSSGSSEQNAPDMSQSRMGATPLKVGGRQMQQLNSMPNQEVSSFLNALRGGR